MNAYFQPLRLKVPPVVALFGPTAVGKTDVAIALANLIEVAWRRKVVAISCDSLQVYQGFDVLTNKPSPRQLELLEHRLISFVPQSSDFNAFLYKEAAHREIDSLLDAGEVPLLVGGTGLYLRAAIAEMDMEPAVDRDSQLWSADTRHPTVVVGLDMDREQLYERIDQRAAVIASEASTEVEATNGQELGRTISKAIGYNYFGLGLAQDEVAELIAKDTRQYARRQLTWMRKIPEIRVFDRTGKTPQESAEEIFAYIGSIYEVRKVAGPR